MIIKVISHVHCNIPQRISIFTYVVLVKSPWEKVAHYSKNTITLDWQKLNKTPTEGYVLKFPKQRYVWRFQVLKS